MNWHVSDIDIANRFVTDAIEVAESNSKAERSFQSVSQFAKDCVLWEEAPLEVPDREWEKYPWSAFDVHAPRKPAVIGDAAYYASNLEHGCSRGKSLAGA